MLLIKIDFWPRRGIDFKGFISALVFYLDLLDVINWSIYLDELRYGRIVVIINQKFSDDEGSTKNNKITLLLKFILRFSFFDISVLRGIRKDLP